MDSGHEPRYFGQYRLDGLIGSGGMGEVYRAHDERRDRVVALKLLPETYGDDTEYQKRFRRESHVVARLREPHVIPIHDYGEVDGRLFIDMRLVDGRDVASVLADEGAMTPLRAVKIVGQVAQALDAAHADGLVHRDIKPSNVLVTDHDFVYVVDFGVAHAVGNTQTSLTMAGSTVGTLDYMAPERFLGGRTDHTVDVYSLACLLHECLTAQRPFTGTDLPSLMFAHLHGEPPRPSEVEPLVPEGFDEVVARGLAKRPEERYASAGQLAEAAENVIEVVGSGRRTPDTARASDSGGTGASAQPARLREADRPTSAPSVPAQVEVVDEVAPVRERSAGGYPATPSEPLGAHPSAPSVPIAVHASSPAPSETAESAELPHGSTETAPSPSPGSSGPVGPTEPSGGSVSTAGTRRRWAWPAAVAVLAVLAVIVSVLVVVRPGGPDTPTPEPVDAPAQAQAPVRTPLAIPTVGQPVPAGPTPGFVEVSPNGRAAYVTNRDAGVVTVLDTALNQVTATIPIPQGPPQYIAFTPDGEFAYVTVYDEARRINKVVVLDTASNEVVTAIDVDEEPFAIAVSPDQRTAVVSSHDTGQLDIVDTATNELVRRVPVAPNPHWVAYNGDGSRLWVANHESNLVSVLDGRTFDVLATVPVGTSPHSLALSPDGRQLSVVNFDSDTVSVIDTARAAVIATVPVGSNPQDIAYFPDGRYIYTANVDGPSVSVIDTRTYRVTATIPAGAAPTSISVRPDGSQAYVTDIEGDVVRVLDLSR